MSLTRRQFLGRSSWLTAASLSLVPGGWAAESARHRPGQKPGRIIHLVADGMSAATLACGDHLSQRVRGRGLVWLELAQRPNALTALMNMRSLNSLVTDSSAASSSWGSGSRVMNGTLNCLPDGRMLRPLYQLFPEAGWVRGLVTTTEITHATPAGFAATVGSRSNADEIAAQYLERRIEVLLGGGSKYFSAKTRADKRDLLADFRAHGYTVCESRAALDAAPTDTRCLGVFASGHLPYTIDHRRDAKARAQVPALAQMTQHALQRLRRSEHFILQVEGGRVDHGAHNCDAAAAFYDLIAFDEALEVCLAFQREQPDTLVVVTTDHGTGNPGLNGSGASFSSGAPLFAHLERMQMSFPEITTLLGATPSSATLRKVLESATGYKVPAAKADLLAAVYEKKYVPLNDGMQSVTAQLGQLLANYLGIGWNSGDHTSDYVPLVAVGPGAERFRGYLQNVDVFGHYVDLARIDYRNPAAPLLTESRPGAADVEDPAAYGWA